MTTRRGRRSKSTRLKIHVDQRTEECGPMTGEDIMQACGFRKPAYDPITSMRPPRGYRNKEVEQRPDGVWVLKDYL